jgi:hypothetical protein
MSYINQFNNSEGQPIINSFSDFLTSSVVNGSSGTFNILNSTNNGIVTAPTVTVAPFPPLNYGNITFNTSGIYTLNMGLILSSGPSSKDVIAQLICTTPNTVNFYLLNATASGYCGNNNIAPTVLYDTDSGITNGVITYNFPGATASGGNFYLNSFGANLTCRASAGQSITLTYNNTNGGFSTNLYIYVNLIQTL